ncbi:MAG: molybdenum cofactor guanylyltransferase [Promethearchaeota archaeon]
MLKITRKNKNLAFAILIGGKSTRFGSDKGIFEFLGKPLISYQIETISKFKKDIFLVANSQEQIQTYTLKINSEIIKDFILDDREIISDREVRTPMIGMYSAFKELSKLGYEKAFILSCDAPLIKYEVAKLLIHQSKGFDCCIPKWNNEFLEPLFAIYPIKKIIKIAKQNLINESYKLTNLLDSNWKIKYISIENEIKPLDTNFVSFININGPIDIEKLMEVYQV